MLLLSGGVIVCTASSAGREQVEIVNSLLILTMARHVILFGDL